MERKLQSKIQAVKIQVLRVVQALEKTALEIEDFATKVRMEPNLMKTKEIGDDANGKITQFRSK